MKKKKSELRMMNTIYWTIVLSVLHIWLKLQKTCDLNGFVHYVSK